MKIIKQYNIAGKVFNNEQEALDFENKLKNNLNLRARNLKLFYWKTKSFSATELINHFCHYRKLTFGMFKDRYIGEIMMIFPDYIKWCIKNIPTFKLDKEEEALWNTSWEYSSGADSYSFTFDESDYIEGDNYNHDLIDWEKSLL